MITIGSIVSLKGRKYRVYQVQTREDRTVPKAVKSIDSHGREDSYLHKDTSGIWFEHPWELVTPLIPVDPKARIFDKIKYLDEKFKSAQEKKKVALKQTEVLNLEGCITPSYITEGALWSSPTEITTIAPNSTDSTRLVYSDYDQALVYYNSLLETRTSFTPY